MVKIIFQICAMTVLPEGKITLLNLLYNIYSLV